MNMQSIRTKGVQMATATAIILMIAFTVTIVRKNNADLAPDLGNGYTVIYQSFGSNRHTCMNHNPLPMVAQICQGWMSRPEI